MSKGRCSIFIALRATFKLLHHLKSRLGIAEQDGPCSQWPLGYLSGSLSLILLFALRVFPPRNYLLVFRNLLSLQPPRRVVFRLWLALTIHTSFAKLFLAARLDNAVAWCHLSTRRLIIPPPCLSWGTQCSGTHNPFCTLSTPRGVSLKLCYPPTSTAATIESSNI